MIERVQASLIDLEELYEHAPSGYLSFLPDGRIIKVNTTLLKWLGYTREQLIGEKRITQLISKGNNIHFQMFFWPMINMAGSVKELNYDFIKRNGEAIPTLVNATAVKDATGNLIAINTSISDITDRKKYEIELLIAKTNAIAEKDRFESLTDLVPEIVFTTDKNGTPDYFNLSFYKYFDLPHRKFNLKFLLSRIHKDDRNKIIAVWQS